MVKVEVKGLADLAKALKELPAEIASRNGGPLGRSLQAAGKVIQTEARMQAPMSDAPYKVNTKRGTYTVQPGRLRAAIQAVRLRKPQRGVNEQVVVKPLSRDVRKKFGLGANYWVPLEFGFTDPAGNKHPGLAFMRGAFAAAGGRALDVFKEKLAAGIKRAAAKVARGKTRGR